MNYHRFYKQPAEELNFFQRKYFAKLEEYNGYTAYLIADESNPNNSPYIAIECNDKTRGIICDVLKYDKKIEFEIIDNNVCNIKNIDEIVKRVSPYLRLIVNLLSNRK